MESQSCGYMTEGRFVSRVGAHSVAMESTRMWLWLFVAVGALLRFYRLDSQSLWYDEGLQYYVVTNFTFGEIFTQAKSFHPPLSFMINYIFLLGGDSDFFLRLPSALFGIASLPLFYLLGKELTSERVALFGVFVLAVSPLHLWYSQDARMYSQLLFFSLLSSVLFIQALKRGERRWWIYYISASAAGVYTHVFMMLSLAVHPIWVLIYHRRHLLPFSASGAVVGVLFLPWALFLPWIAGFFRRVSAMTVTGGSSLVGRADFSWAAAPYTFFVYSAGFSLGPTVAELHEDRSMGFVMHFLPSLSVIGAMFAILSMIGIVVIYKQFGMRPVLFTVLSFVIAVVGAAVYSFAPRATFSVRYTLVAFPYFCLIIGAALALATSANRAIGTVALLAVLIASSTSLYNYHLNPRYAKEDVRSAVTFWRENSKNELLLSYRAKYTADRYLDPAERHRHFMIGGNAVESVDRALAARSTSSAYVLLARDWNDVREKHIRSAFAVTQEATYPGVKILRISK